MPLEKTSQIKKRLLGPVEKSVLRSLNAQKFEEKEKWGRELAIAYARQLDDATKVKREVLEILDEADTASKTWHQKLMQVEKYVVAETTLGNIGPKLLTLMEKLGCTPVVVKAVTNGKKEGETSGQQPVDDDEADLARVIQLHSQATGT